MSLTQRLRDRFHPLWRIRRTPWLNRCLSAVDFPVRARVAGTGCRMFAYWYRDLNWIAGRRMGEPAVRDALLALASLGEGAAFWDVGANLGYYSWLMHALARPASIVAVEPLPANVRLLERTAALNRIAGFAVVAAAVDSAPGRARLRVDDRSGAASQLEKLFQESGSLSAGRMYGLDASVEVKVETLDSILALGHPAPSLIKMDVEEAEELALRGAPGLLASARPAIVFECYRRGAIDILGKCDYSVLKLDEAGNFAAIPRERSSNLLPALLRAVPSAAATDS